MARDKEKQKIAQHNSYLKNKERIRDRTNDKRSKIRNYLIEYKESKPCKQCNNFYPYYMMQFDHLKDKEFKISSIGTHGRTLEDIKKEIDKCEVVCANCHAARSYLRGQHVPVKLDPCAINSAGQSSKLLPYMSVVRIHHGAPSYCYLH